MLKTEGFGAVLEVEMLKKCTHFWKLRCSKCTPLWCEAHFKVKMLKAPHARNTFEGSDVVLRKGFCTLPKVSENGGFCSMSKK